MNADDHRLSPAMKGLSGREYPLYGVFQTVPCFDKFEIIITVTVVRNNDLVVMLFILSVDMRAIHFQHSDDRNRLDRPVC